jgi:hypothetical protein
MKYLKQLNDPNNFKPNVLEPENKILKKIYNFIVIFPMIMYLGVKYSILPIVIVVDFYRSLKFSYHVLNRQFLSKVLKINLQFGQISINKLMFPLVKMVRYSRVMIYYYMKPLEKYRVPYNQKQTA